MNFLQGNDGWCARQDWHPIYYHTSHQAWYGNCLVDPIIIERTNQHTATLPAHTRTRSRYAVWIISPIRDHGLQGSWHGGYHFTSSPPPLDWHYTGILRSWYASWGTPSMGSSNNISTTNFKVRGRCSNVQQPQQHHDDNIDWLSRRREGRAREELFYTRYQVSKIPNTKYQVLLLGYYYIQQYWPPHTLFHGIQLHLLPLVILLIVGVFRCLFFCTMASIR